MPLSKSRDYLSIGEVLEVLRPEFPDVSISKLRFLESEKLISPDRTPSGYRKFYDDDIARLRFILSLQRDHFLPLKVIKQRLADVDSGAAGYGAPPPGAGGNAGPEVQEGRQGSPSSSPAGDREPSVDLTGAQLSRGELMSAADLTESQLAGLEEFGLLSGDGGNFYDEHDLAVARAARGFFTHGLEPRHLRMYRQFAEREAALYDQIVSPLVHRRDADARRAAFESLQELMALSRRMRDAVLRLCLRSRY